LTTGEGGAICTNDSKLAQIVRSFRDWGRDCFCSGGENNTCGKRFSQIFGNLPFGYDHKYVYSEIGYNLKMTDIQAALGISQLKKLDTFIEKRQKIAELYNELLRDCEFVEIPETKEGLKHGWHIYTVLLKNIDRNKFFTYMRKNDIGVNVHYIPIYHFTYYRKHFHFHRKDYPVTEDIFKRIITLPIYPMMSSSDLELVVKTIKAWSAI
jgi:dTDP-4-amino-4,6-dideoxygalactose transaminase